MINYLNLTNGLEFIGTVKNYKVVRIQSTICEAKNYDKLIRDLDYNFLLDLAQGNEIKIYDTSAQKRVSRALYQGVEFIKYALNRRWLGKEEKAFVKGNDVTEYFREVYKGLSNEAKKKLDYVKKFLNTDEIKIDTYCKRTLHDGNYEYFRKLLAGIEEPQCDGQIKW